LTTTHFVACLLFAGRSPYPSHEFPRVAVAATGCERAVAAASSRNFNHKGTRRATKSTRRLLSAWSNRNVAEIAVWLNFVERILSFFLFSCSPAANAADGTERGEQEGEAALKRSLGRRRRISVRSQKQFSLSLSLSLSFLL